MVLIGNSTEDLQNSLNILKAYCDKWGLEVNVSKTKIIVFRKRDQIKNESWYYNNELIEVVNNFTGSFVFHSQYISKALRASGIPLNNICKYEVSPEISMQLFDSFVGSILLYCSPVC